MHSSARVEDFIGRERGFDDPICKVALYMHEDEGDYTCDIGGWDKTTTSFTSLTFRNEMAPLPWVELGSLLEESRSFPRGFHMPPPRKEYNWVNSAGRSRSMTVYPHLHPGDKITDSEFTFIRNQPFYPHAPPDRKDFYVIFMTRECTYLCGYSSQTQVSDISRRVYYSNTLKKADIRYHYEPNIRKEFQPGQWVKIMLDGEGFVMDVIPIMPADLPLALCQN
jgi:hypothetical protein